MKIDFWKIKKSCGKIKNKKIAEIYFLKNNWCEIFGKNNF